jgi:hypothetical protein
MLTMIKIINSLSGSGKSGYNVSACKTNNLSEIRRYFYSINKTRSPFANSESLMRAKESVSSFSWSYCQTKFFGGLARKRIIIIL